MTGLDAIAAGIRQTGARFDPAVLAETRAAYRPLVESQPWMARPRQADCAYGDDPRQRLDIYPADRAAAPILLFVHGGGFIGGDKAGDAVFYANVGRYFASRGFCAVTMNYRLAPAHRWPAGARDVDAALRWIVDHGAAHGGDPARIVLLGQSAGASHAATALFDPRFEADHRRAILGAALMSGFYRASPPLTGGPLAYFGEDEAAWRDRSPVTHVAAGQCPVLLSVAEYDPAPIAVQTLDLARALTGAGGRMPRLHWFADHNHVSTVHGLGLGDDRVGRTLADFFTACLA